MRKIALKNIVWKEGKYYVGWNLNTNVSSFGDTRRKALSSLKEALELYLEDTPLSKLTKVERPDIVNLELQHA
jgi:predicted RNase H-like HicB family nuclease